MNPNLHVNCTECGGEDIVLKVYQDEGVPDCITLVAVCSTCGLKSYLKYERAK